MNDLHARVGAVRAGPWRATPDPANTRLDAARHKSTLLRLLAWLRHSAR